MNILILIGAILLFDKLLDKFAARDKLIRRIDTLGKQFTLFQREANETITKYQNSNVADPYIESIKKKATDLF